MEKGRKLILNDKMIKDISNAIAIGFTNKSACGIVGITERTFYLWMEKGEKAIDDEEDNIYRDFYESIKKAEAAFISKRLTNIKRQAEDGKWQADAWLLERRFPSDYGNRGSVEVTGNHEKPVEVEHKGSIGTYAVMLPDNGRD